MNIFYPRFGKVGNNYIVSSEAGKWSIISPEEYKSIIMKKPSLTLQNKLKENGLFLPLKEVFSSLDERYKGLNSGPSLHIVVPTDRCNHSCVYCHSSALPDSSDVKDMDKETADKIIDFILSSPNIYANIEFQGGEPLLAFDMIKYFIEKTLERNSPKKIQFDVVTNLSLMTDDMMEYFIKRKVGLCTTLDGPKDLHDKNRVILKGGSSHKFTSYWIQRIRRKYSYPINALMVTTKYSLPYVKEIIDEYLRFGFGWIQLRPLDKLGFAKGNEKISITAEEYLKFWKEGMFYLFEINKKHYIPDRYVYYLLSKLYGINPYYVDLQSPCGAVIGQIAYDTKGDIYSCDEGRNFNLFCLGNVQNMDYKDVIKSEKACSIVASSVTDTLPCNSCVWKPFCGICPVLSYSETGTLVPILSKSERCKIHKGQFEFLVNELNGKNKEILLSWIEKGAKK